MSPDVATSGDIAVSDDFAEDEDPEPGVPFAGHTEFIEDEDPADGAPYLEMTEHYGIECWKYYASQAVRTLGAAGLARLFRKPRAANTGGPNELIEDEPPTPGMPNLCGEYSLPTLEIEG